MDKRLYIVRRSDGQFYRGSYTTWCADAREAKIYTRVGSARGAIRHLLNHYDWVDRRTAAGVPDGGAYTFETIPVEVIYQLDQAAPYP